MNLFKFFFGLFKTKQGSTRSVDDLDPFAARGYKNSIFDGSKFYGGFGDTEIHTIDYWTLRRRSAQLFNDNLYARGMIRRLITNEINTGLMPEACPDEIIIGLEEDSLNDWTEEVENRFGLWTKDATLCDFRGRATFGAVQREARMEALISGDVLVILRPSKHTGLPQVQLVSGNNVQTPLGSQVKLRSGRTIQHGVEITRKGRIVAYHIRQDDGGSKRITARGRRSKRRQAWLVFGTDKRLDDIRGQPLLSLVLQSLREIDRYRDSTQRKAVVNSILAMFIKKSKDKMGTLPITGGAMRRDQVDVEDGDGTQRKFNIVNQIPGAVLEELQFGEEPVQMGSSGTDSSFGEFEEAIIHTVAWANEIPPEILRLSFSSNYSASQAAINEFKIYLNKVWSDWGETFCTPIYVDWLLSETLQGKVHSTTLLSSWRDHLKHDVFGAWVSVDWYGSIKPSTDMLKQAKGSKLLVDEGWTTNAREARMLTGTKFSKNIKRIRRENELKVDAMRALTEFNEEQKQKADV